MKACIAHGAGDLRVDDLRAPRISENEIAVRVVYGGICGSDLHYARHGANGSYVLREPLILGHEIVGLIDRIGSAVEGDFRPGEPVAVHPAWPAPPAGTTVSTGLNRLPGGTYLGSASTNPHTQGGFTELIPVRPEQIRRLPTGLPLRRAALAEPLAIALHGIARAPDAVRGARVLVSGSGPIGCLAVAALAAHGASQITATDLHEFPLRTAESAGATETLRLGADNAPEPDSFDLVIESAGAVPSLNTALRAVRVGGTVIQLGILPKGPLGVELASLVSKEVSYYGSQRFDTELDEAIRLLHATPALDAIVSHVYPLEKAGDAFAQAADSATSSKVLLRIGDDSP
jgi:L-idonate 5-dehydrogenase